MNFAKLIYLFSNFYIVIMSKMHSDGKKFYPRLAVVGNS